MMKKKKKTVSILSDREKRTRKLVTELNQLYEIFYEDCKDWLDAIYLHNDLLETAVISIVEDFLRFETFTDSEQGADRHKYAAFIIKWISKIKPIQIKPEATKINKYTLYVNSSFAIFAGLSHIDSKLFDNLPPEYHKFLLYSTYYRNLSGRQLAGSIYLLEENAKLTDTVRKQ